MPSVEQCLAALMLFDFGLPASADVQGAASAKAARVASWVPAAALVCKNPQMFRSCYIDGETRGRQQLPLELQCNSWFSESLFPPESSD